MRRRLAVIGCVLWWSAIASAQTGTVTWTGPDNAASAAQAQGLVFTFYVNGGSGVVLTGVTCTGATVFACTAPVPTGTPVVIGTRYELDARLTAASPPAEVSARSAPFIRPPTAVTNFRVQ